MCEDTISSFAHDPDSVIRFSEIPKQKFPEGASPAEISKHNMDNSYVLGNMISGMKGKYFCGTCNSFKKLLLLKIMLSSS